MEYKSGKPISGGNTSQAYWRIAERLRNRRTPNGTYGGVRGGKHESRR